MDTTFSTNRKFKRMFVNILSIVVILAMAFANTGSPVQAAQRTVPGDWDRNAVRKASVLKEDGGYKMWYDGVGFLDQTQIGLATSTDGASWTKYSDNPVLVSGPEAWESSGEHGPFVMKDGDLYKMWYEGSDGSVRQLGYATSLDGVTWTKYEGNPVLRAEPGYDQDVAGHGSVLYDDGMYKLWYHAIGDQGILIAYATSPDGINWTKEGPVLLQEAGVWDEGGLWGPSVLKVDDTYWMWYSAGSPIYPASIGAATSPDGMNWTRVGDAPVITIADNHLGDPHVIFDAGIFKMWFNNFNDGKIYYAESNDGIQWSEPVSALSPGLMFPLEGWHDGSYGGVDPGACVAFGWSADPDDRDRDVQIRILSDGDEVAATTASDYGEDMEQYEICPEGTCRFTVNLWDLISHDQEHQITIQAYDVESADWWNLEGTPKSLTCYTPSPHFTVFPEWEFFDGLDWPDGAIVSISVEGKPQCSFERESWGGFFNGNFPQGCDIQTGDVVTFDDGTTNRWHEVRNLYVTDVDTGENTVMGKADEGETVYVWPHDGWFEPLDAFVGESGVWQVDLDDASYTIRDDSVGRSEIRDEMGNATASDWHVTHPRFTVFPEWEWFDGNDWPNEAMVTITVEGKDDCTTMKESWGYFFNGSFGEGCDLEIGDTVTFTDGETIRTHTVQNLKVTKANHDDDTIKGIADPGAEVYVWPHATGEQQLAIAKTQGAAKGKWSLDFSGIYDLTPGECGRSEIRDEFGNSTAVDWCISNPRIVASESGDWFWTTEFKPGDLNISIYDSPDVGANLLWSGQQVADEWGFAIVGSDIHGQDLVPGDYLVISDGDSQKSLILQPISVTMFDTQYEFMTGFAPAGTEVWAAAGPQDWQERIMIQADPVTGAWLADFKTIGFDITEEMRPWSYAHIYDEDGDANEGSTPPPQANPIVIANHPDWVDSGITINAGQSFTIESIGLMNPCSDTYPNGADYCILYTPEGAEGVVPYENEFGIFPGPGLPFMALLGRIGDGEPFYVGAGGAFTAEVSGTLWFTPNDNLRTDNQGAYSVQVWLEP